MIKALLKKQFLELGAFFTLQGSKKGKQPSKLATMAIGLLILYSILSMGFLFWQTASTLCEPLVRGGIVGVFCSDGSDGDGHVLFHCLVGV